MIKYDAFEMQEVAEFDGGICEPIHTEDDAKGCARRFWSVYGHKQGQGVTCIADCDSKEYAEYIFEGLNLLFSYRNDVQTRIDVLKEQLLDEVNIDDIQDQIAHWEATLKNINALIK